MTHYTENCSHDFDVTRAGMIDTLVLAVGKWLKIQRLKASLRHERANLLTMSDSMLKDIGIDRSSADKEAMRDDIPAARRPWNRA